MLFNLKRVEIQMSKDLLTLKQVIHMLNSQLYIERVMLFFNVLISGVGIGLIFFNDEFGAVPNNSDTNWLQKTIWIIFIIVCCALIGFHTYLIYYFRKMGSFYLEILAVNDDFNVRRNRWAMNILILLIVIALFK